MDTVKSWHRPALNTGIKIYIILPRYLSYFLSKRDKIELSADLIEAWEINLYIYIQNKDLHKQTLDV